MGRSREEALGTIRISMGRSTSEEEVLALAETLLTVIERQLRLK
jgi:cysteine sulfinate desulfinase/cysteine desulfurase-like protein